ncbi:hypothetical protein DKT68_15340 [Micromonospora acroterricola]|uniref:Uncharacterized protein n=1 Tax=Micromonospora acroterricola TaxID=2202421 RepID=A0A317D159_9ACTN|nr:hypothetical protein [Micromonospora acroterricola]PWR08588.1 hypothetical protein DKT68_15340 [Micromonospora acroterricola]
MVDPDDVGPAIERDLADAIANVLAEHEKSMVTKWVALVESMDADGDRGLWTLTSDGVKAWDTVGLLQHGLHIQQAQTLRPEDDD